MTLVRIIGAGLAGSEAALQLAGFGFDVHLYDMKPNKKTPAQKLDGLCELVCSNSFRSNKPTNAVGLIKDEMLILDGQLMKYALEAQIPAGDALAVDREHFSRLVESALLAHPRIKIVREEVKELMLDDVPTIIATGPLTADALAADIVRYIGQDRLDFYDAIAPIIDTESIDMNEAFVQSRWQEGEGGDYINCPMDKETYQAFIEKLKTSTRAKAHEFEDAHFFEGCLPLEVMAERGDETLRFGPFKPVGLTDPRTGKWPHAVLQLRMEDKYGSSYNLVGCQTRMTIGEQKEAFALIPALKNANFMRFGSIHRNTYVDGPRVLDEKLRLKDKDGKVANIFLAGQITGVEGYVESMAMGLIVARIIAQMHGVLPEKKWPFTSALGALYGHVLGYHRANTKERYVPSNIIWAMIPPLEEVTKKGRSGRAERRQMLYDRAISAIKELGGTVNSSPNSSFHEASL